MRNHLNVVGALVAALSLSTSFGCMTHTQPSVEDVKGVRILEQPDPRTLEIFGHVSAQHTIQSADWRRAEELTLESLKAEAKRVFPDTAVLFHVAVMPADGENTFEATGIAARRRGS